MSGNLKDWHEMLPIAQRIYRRHSAGCCWHVLLDDHNCEPETARFCADYAAKNACAQCRELSPLALRASTTQLTKLAACAEKRS